MVAAASAATSAASSNRPNPKPPSTAQVDPTRPPLIPADNSAAAAAASRRLSTKRIVSRYPSPSPISTPRPSTPPSALPNPRRSLSVGRNRPDLGGGTPTRALSSATTTTTRSLSVSFQGESFFYHTSKAKPASPKPSAERRRSTTPVRPSTKPTTTTAKQLENSRPFDCWPTARSRNPSCQLTRSLDCSVERKEPILETVRLLQHAVVFDNGGSPRRHSSFETGDLSASSDTDSVSSGSNSGGPEHSAHPSSRANLGICVPARFWQEPTSRIRRIPEPRTPISKSPPPPKLVSVKKSLVHSPLSSPRSVSSPLRGPIRLPSPSKLAGSPSRGMASPLRTRGSGMVGTSPAGQQANAPSIISFAAEVRRAKKGESRIEEAHMLRLFHNRQLQWRFVNARARASLVTQRMTVEKILYNAWRTTLGMHDSVSTKRIKLQLLTQYIKLTSILKGQMDYLEDWSLIDRDHSSSLSGAIEALKASTLRLPVVGGARADLQEVKDAVGSALDVMQAMGSSICYLLSKVDAASSLVSELAKVAEQERLLMDQSRDLLSTAAAMHVTYCSLQGHILQRRRWPSKVRL